MKTLYDQEKQELYIYQGKNLLYLLDGEDIQQRIINNRTNETFKQYIPLDQRQKIANVPGLHYKTTNNLLNIFINRCNFGKEKIFQLSPEYQRLQLAIQFFAFPFASLIKTKPIMVFKGGKGSGKSITLQTFGKFLSHLDYCISILPDRDTFVRTVCNNRFYFIEEVADYVKWLPQIINAVVLGNSLTSRKLYTNNAFNTISPQCFLGFATRKEESFQSLSVVEKTLFFHLEPLKTYIDEVQLYKCLETYSNELFSEYLDNLNHILSIIKEANVSNIRKELVLADWLNFAQICNKALRLDQCYQTDFDDFLNIVAR